MSRPAAVSPVIIVGMHRSGTSMITGILQDLGLFVGYNLDENNEPLFFANLNNWLLRQCAAEWDFPLPFRLVEELPEVRETLIQRSCSYLSSPRSVFFLGLVRYLRYRS